MKNYRNISFWENNRRCQILNDFRNKVVDYFNKSRVSSNTPEIYKVRSDINRKLPETIEILEAAGMAPSVVVTPAPAIGGYVRNITLLDNIFNLEGDEIAPITVVDALERAVGAYEADYSAAVCRTFNPLWWARQLLESFAQLPFYLIGAAGFNANKVRASTLGHSIRFVFLVIPAVPALLALLDFVGWIEL